MVTEWKDAGSAYEKFFQSPTDELRRALLDPLIIQALEPQDKSILDLGCGEGYLTRKLKELHAREVTGADVSQDLIAAARARDQQGVYFVYDLMREELPGDKSYDGIVANMVLMGVPDLRLAYRKIAKYLKNNGTVVASIVNPYYGYPVGVWKRQVRSILTGHVSPQLLINSYFHPKDDAIVLPGGNERIKHFQRPMSSYINDAMDNGLALIRMIEPEISLGLKEQFKKTFLSRQLDEVPLFLILKFVSRII